MHLDISPRVGQSVGRWVTKIINVPLGLVVVECDLMSCCYLRLRRVP